MSLISVVIPAYRAGRFIRRALESVLAQTDASWEAVIVEDGSRDETESVVDELSHACRQRVVYDNSGANRGVSQSRNRGLALSRGDVIAFLDADDWWSPEHLASGSAVLSSGFEMCASGFYIYSESEGKVIESITPSLAQLRCPLESMFSSNFVGTASSMMLKKEVGDTLGDFDADLKVGEDCDYWMRALGKGFRLGCSHHVTCYYTKHCGSAMSETMTVAEQTVRFYRKHLNSEFIDRAVRRRRLAESLVNYARLLWRSDLRGARRLFCEALRYEPLNGSHLSYAAASVLLSSCIRRPGAPHALPLK